MADAGLAMPDEAASANIDISDSCNSFWKANPQKDIYRFYAQLAYNII